MKQEDTSIYFDSYYQGTFPDFDYAVDLVKQWLINLVSFTMCEPVTLVIK